MQGRQPNEQREAGGPSDVARNGLCTRLWLIRLQPWCTCVDSFRGRPKDALDYWLQPNIATSLAVRLQPLFWLEPEVAMLQRAAVSEVLRHLQLCNNLLRVSVNQA